MKVSIIIPIYGVESYIESCLKSVCVQDYNNLEVILVDDASPDKSIALAKKFIEGCDRKEIFRIITHKENRGLSAARNTGIEASAGDYIYFLDSDDQLASPNSISLLVKAVVENKADIAIGNYLRVCEDGNYTSKYDKPQQLRNQSLISAFVKGDIPVTAWNKLISKHFFKQGLRFKNGILNEDELFSYQILFTNPSVAMVGEVTYLYYQREGSIMNTANLKRIESPVVVYEEVVSEYLRLGGNNHLILQNLDHFAFRRYVAVMRSAIPSEKKRELYERIKRSQKRIKGIGKMRYIFNGHIYHPVWEDL